MSKKVILFNSPTGNKGKTTSALLTMKALIYKGYTPKEFCVHTCNGFQNLSFKDKLMPCDSSLLDQCTDSDICCDFSSYEFTSDFTSDEFLKSGSDFFCLLNKADQWVLIFSATDLVCLIGLLKKVLFALDRLVNLMLVTAIRRDNLTTKVEAAISDFQLEMMIDTSAEKRKATGVDKYDFFLSKNQENAQKAVEYIEKLGQYVF